MRDIFSELRRQGNYKDYNDKKIGLTLERIVFNAASKLFPIQCLFLDADLMQVFYCIFSNNVFMCRIISITNAKVFLRGFLLMSPIKRSAISQYGSSLPPPPTPLRADIIIFLF